MSVFVRFCGIVFLCGGMLFSLPAPSHAKISSMSASEAYKEARQSYARGEFERALELLQHAHTKDPKALYVYNMGRILEAIGRLQEAHETYLRVTAISSADKKVKDLSQAQLVKLKPLLKVTVLRFRGLEPGSVVQVDKDIVLSLTQDLELKPGTRQVCILGAKSQKIQCWRRDFKAGSRTSFPIESNDSTRGTLVWTGVKDGRQFVLDGFTLLFSVKKLKTIEVDVGTHMVGVIGAKKKRTVQTSVIPGETSKIAQLLAGPKRKKKSAGKSKATSAGIWPWVVAGTGGVMAAGGGFLAMQGAKDNDAAYKNELGQDETRALVDEANQKTTTGYIVAGVGVAALAGGLTWWWMDQGSAPEKKKKRQKSPKKRAHLWIAPVGPSAIFVGGSF